MLDSTPAPFGQWSAAPAPSQGPDAQANSDAPMPSAQHAAPDASPSRTKALPSASAWLRAIGATAILGAALSYLFDSASSQGVMPRYFSLLGLTATLTAAGVFFGVHGGDAKTGRLSLGLSLSTLPVHAMVLGALSYSTLGYHPGGLDAPLWDATSWAQVGPLFAIAALALPILSFVALRVLVPGSVRTFAPALVTLLAFCLVPRRDPGAVAPLAALAGLVALVVDARLRRRGHTLSTLEARALRALLFAPALLILGRDAMLYDARGFFSAPTGIVLGAFALYLARHAGKGASLVRFFAGGMVALSVGTLAADLLPARWHEMVTVAIFANTAVIAAATLGAHTGSRALRISSLGLWATLSFATAAVGIAFYVTSPSAGSADGFVGFHLVHLAGALVIGSMGLATQARASVLAGAAVGITSVVAIAVSTIRLPAIDPTWLLAGLGAVALVGAVLVERGGARWRARAVHVRARLADWSY